MKRLIILLLIVGCEESDSIINLDAPEYTDSFSCTYHINYYEPIAGILLPINSWDWELDSLKSKIDTLDIFQGLNLNDAILNCTSNNSLLWLEESSSILLDTTWCDCEEITGVSLWGQYYDIKTTTSLKLQTQQLSGSIPSEIGNLTNLTHLQLNHNQLTGEIPPEIGNLTNLTYLHLSSNGLTGTIPPEIGNLTNLSRLYLSENQLTGSIPPEIGNLTNLTVLYLRNNQLTGEIPSEIGNLTNLGWLFLFNNQLTGEIPIEICNQGDSTPDVYNNQLCPPYPECISQSDIDSQDTSNCP